MSYIPSIELSGPSTGESVFRSASSYITSRENTGISFTQESWAESDLGPSHSVESHGSTAIAPRLHQPDIGLQEDVEMRDPNPFDSLTEDQKETLALFRKRCERNGRLPDSGDIEAIQKLEPGLDSMAIHAWLDVNVRITDSSDQVVRYSRSQDLLVD